MGGVHHDCHCVLLLHVSGVCSGCGNEHRCVAGAACCSACILYVFFIRKAYLAKKKNIDLIEIMRQPLSEWLEKENYFKQLDEQIGDVRN